MENELYVTFIYLYSFERKLIHLIWCDCVFTNLVVSRNWIFIYDVSVWISPKDPLGEGSVRLFVVRICFKRIFSILFRSNEEDNRHNLDVMRNYLDLMWETYEVFMNSCILLEQSWRRNDEEFCYFVVCVYQQSCINYSNQLLSCTVRFPEKSVRIFSMGWWGYLEDLSLRTMMKSVIDHSCLGGHMLLSASVQTW